MNTTTLVDSLLRQLRERGIRIVYDGDDKMHLAGNVAEADENVMAALKAFRPHILARVKETLEPSPDPTAAPARPEWETCRECRAMVHHTMTPEDALVLCNRVGAKGHVGRNGFLGVPAAERCPYHPPNSSGHGGR